MGLGQKRRGENRTYSRDDESGLSVRALVENTCPLRLSEDALRNENPYLWRGQQGACSDKG